MQQGDSGGRSGSERMSGVVYNQAKRIMNTHTGFCTEQGKVIEQEEPMLLHEKVRH